MFFFFFSCLKNGNCGQLSGSKLSGSKLSGSKLSGPKLSGSSDCECKDKEEGSTNQITGYIKCLEPERACGLLVEGGLDCTVWEEGEGEREVWGEVPVRKKDLYRLLGLNDPFDIVDHAEVSKN